jgi:hypothetical protein
MHLTQFSLRCPLITLTALSLFCSASSLPCLIGHRPAMTVPLYNQTRMQPCSHAAIHANAALAAL